MRVTKSLASDRSLVEHIDNYAENLTEWEIEFVESLVRRVQAGNLLTDKQREIALRISEEKTE